MSRRRKGPVPLPDVMGELQRWRLKIQGLDPPHEEPPVPPPVVPPVEVPPPTEPTGPRFIYLAGEVFQIDSQRRIVGEPNVPEEWERRMFKQYSEY